MATAARRRGDHAERSRDGSRVRGDAARTCRAATATAPAARTRLRHRDRRTARPHARGARRRRRSAAARLDRIRLREHPMNRPARLIPFAILAAAAFAQQETERSAANVALLVQTTASEAAPAIEPLLKQLMRSEPVRQALLLAAQSSLPKDTAASVLGLTGGPRSLTENSVVVELGVVFPGAKAPEIPAAGADAMARALHEQLDAVLSHPRAQAIEHTLRRAEGGREDAERRIDEAEHR